jgi:hypothetical protein
VELVALILTVLLVALAVVEADALMEQTKLVELAQLGKATLVHQIMVESSAVVVAVRPQLVAQVVMAATVSLQQLLVQASLDLVVVEVELDYKASCLLVALVVVVTAVTLMT